MLKTMRKASVAGFSLVELMVVVAIIGILAAVAIPNFQRFQRKARQTEGKSLLSGIVTAEEAFRSEFESYVSDLSAAGFAPTGQLNYNAGVGAGFVAVPLYMSATALNGAQNSTASAAVCVAANCMVMAAGGAGMVGSCAAGGAAPTATTFGAANCGFIGGMANDVWTIDQAKLLTNTTDGVP